MTGQEILNHVSERAVSPEGLKKIQARRKMVEKLRDARQEWTGAGRKLRIHKPGVLTIDQSRMKNAKRRFVAKVLVLGNHVADLEFDPKEAHPRFVLLDGRMPSIPAAERAIEWKNDDAASRKIGTIVRACKALTPGSAELQIQLELVKRLDESKRTNPSLVALRPVKPFGLPTEIATFMNLEGNVATGNVDVLARTRNADNPSDAGDFVVLELKRPTLAARDVSDALKQAIQYAAALTIEANAFAGPQVTNPATPYRQLFSDDRRAEAAKYDGRPLVAHAVAVLPARLEAAAKAALSKLELEQPLIVRSGHPPIGVGVLLFEAEGDKSTASWRLSSGPEAFRWVDHPNAWKPRQPKQQR